ncbi:DUF1015 domain-containing protein [Nocardioides sp. JQ2195]|uniref:DUF1015 family protein n=1 Tax=Nocardioides sp. JQ2195 TaxID=2592334 RepID=UPI00143E4D2D|nr:DUF1015 family protein [Nocardioides sp. JQ2195]QIX28006.1 DUF1015 domain-containing protein [Nocardioides sp. JQ2195]
MTDTLVAGGTLHPAHAVDGNDYQPPVEGLFVYRLRRGADEHVGVVADVELEGFADGRVRGHEAVDRARVEGLVDHFAAVPRRTELVALLHDGGDEVDRLVAATMDEPPVLDFVGPDGWQQSVWRVPDAAGSLLVEAFGRSVHDIADGHHRVAASLEMWERAGRPAEAALLCIIYPPRGLRLSAFRRRIRGPVDASHLRALLAARWDVTECAPGALPPRSTGVYVGSTWLAARLTADRPSGVAGLDLTLLTHHVFGPLVGGSATERIESIPVTTPPEELTSRCDRDGGALFVLAPPTLQQLREVADLGEVMPPKTTYFDPKPYAGVFVR